MPTKPLLISIIIPTLNEEKNIGQLLKSITESKDFDSKSLEIIIVDNPKTTDKTKQIAKSFHNVKILEKGPERSTQRNYGAKNSKGKYLFFVDADMEFSHLLIREILDKIKQTKVKNGFIIPERIPGNSIYCKAVNLEKKIYDNNTIISAMRLFPASNFQQIKGYNTDLIMGEDWDLDIRLKKTNLSLDFLKNPLLHHEENLGFFGSIKKKIYYAKNFKNLSITSDKSVSPIYRYAILFSKPKLIFQNPIIFLYLTVLKSAQFSIGLVTMLKTKVLG